MHLTGILETALYCSDLAAAETFYRDVLGLAMIAKQPGRMVVFRCGDGVLLLFDPAVTAAATTVVAGSAIPLHGTHGIGHMAFRVDLADIPAWRDRLASHGVSIEREVAWLAGGHSVYFRDPAGHSIEFGTTSIWWKGPA